MAVIQRRGKLEVVEAVLDVAEAHADAAGDPDPHLWRSLMHGPRDLPSYTHERAIEVAFALNQQNPLAHRITELNRDFVVGDGITWSVRNPDVAELVEEFWGDEVNDLDQRNHDFANELGLFGELCLEAFTGDVSGVLQLGYIDPAQIKGVDHVEDNPLVAETVRVKKKGFGIRGEPKTVVRTRKGKLDGEVFFFKVNSMSNSTRGWPDLLHVADWLDAYDQLLWEILERARLSRAFIWDVLLKGFGQAEVDRWVRQHGQAPRSGSIRAHNENEEWKAVAPSLGSHETAREAQVILEHISAGSGFPKHWFAQAEDVNKATAQEMGMPTIRRLSVRQKFYKGVVRELLRFVLAKAAEKGRLKVDDDGLVAVFDEDGRPVMEGEDGRQRQQRRARPIDLVTIHAPEISPKDIASFGELLQQVAAALAIAQAEGWVGGRVPREVLAVVLAGLGYEFDPNQEEPEEERETEEEPPSRRELEEAIDRVA